MKTMRWLGVLLILVGQPFASADENAVYESHTQVSLGRVFLSPADREYLDARRHLKPISADATDAAAPAAATRPAAGYIKGPNGESRVWQQGEFVTTTVDNPKLDIPGQIKIVRHGEKDDADDED